MINGTYWYNLPTKIKPKKNFMDAAAIDIIKTFNQNIEWLKAQGIAPAITQNKDEIELPAAMKILNRSRSWIKTRMKTQKDLSEMGPCNTNWFLVQDLDWFKEGGRLVFKRTSIERLKAEMKRMGAPQHCEF